MRPLHGSDLIKLPKASIKRTDGPAHTTCIYTHTISLLDIYLWLVIAIVAFSIYYPIQCVIIMWLITNEVCGSKAVPHGRFVHYSYLYVKLRVFFYLLIIYVVIVIIFLLFKWWLRNCFLFFMFICRKFSDIFNNIQA